MAEEKIYKTQKEIVELLERKEFKEATNSNGVVKVFYSKDGNFKVEITRKPHIAVLDSHTKRTLVSFCQPVFDISNCDEKLIIMAGDDPNDNWVNIYLRKDSND